jgi:SAM-dependent methyltransferase
MRRDWDERARKGAYFYIATWRQDWDETSFFRSGEEDCEGLVSPVLEHLKFLTHGKTMLELGCGTGWMTRTFAQKFSRVLGFDVSHDLDRARLLNDGIDNITWVQGNGADLSKITSGSVDFVFSYLVPQHLPARKPSPFLRSRNSSRSGQRRHSLVSI